MNICGIVAEYNPFHNGHLYQLQKAKELGYSWEIEESTEHIRCFAVPVRKNGEIVGAVSIAIPIFRYHKEKEKNIIKALKETAEKIENGFKLS